MPANGPCARIICLGCITSAVFFGHLPAPQVAGSQGMHPMEGLLYIGSACTMCLMAQVGPGRGLGGVTGGVVRTGGPLLGLWVC
jgi:hypothetical protein